MRKLTYQKCIRKKVKWKKEAFCIVIFLMENLIGDHSLISNCNFVPADKRSLSEKKNRAMLLSYSDIICYLVMRFSLSRTHEKKTKNKKKNKKKREENKRRSVCVSRLFPASLAFPR